MSTEVRSVITRLRVEAGQHITEMGRAADASTKAGDAAEKAGQRGDRALAGLARTAAENEVQWRRTGTALVAVGTGISAIGLAAAKTGIDYNRLQQTSRAALTTLLGSARAANAQMDKLDDFARTSPFSKQTFISAQQQMLAFGIEAQKVVPYLDAIQNAVAASGGSNDDIAGIVATMSKVQSSAKITAEDLNELGNRGVNAAELIGSQMGMTGAEVRESISKGSLDAGQALDALAAGMSQRFDGAAENVKTTFDGAVDRVKAAWRDLGSALAEPLVGTNGGGLLTDLLNELADALRALEDLPGPAKVAALGITGLVGASSLAAGGFLLLAPRIVETRASLDKLRTDMPRTSRALGVLGTAAKVASIGMAALAATRVAAEVFRDTDVASVEKFTAALIDLNEQAGAGRLEQLAQSQSGLLDSGLGGIAASLAEIKSNSEGLGKVGNDIAKFFGFADEKGANSLKAIDESLAGLVASGNAEEAATSLEYLESRAALVGVSASELRDLLPGYTDALAAASNEQRLAGESGADAAGGMRQTAEEAKAAEEALKKAQDVARGSAEGFVNLGDSVDDAKVSLSDWLKELEAQAKALESFTSNSIKAAKRGLDDGLIASLQEAGPAGALRMAQLADATEEEIARANAAWRRGQAAVDEYVDTVVKVPESKSTVIRVTEEQALRGIRAIQRAVDSLTGRTIGIRVAGPGGGGLSTANADGGFYVGGIKRRAGGGFDEYGRPVARVSQIRQAAQGAVMWGEPETGWEAYISGKPGMRARNQGIAAQAVARLGGVATFADGGIVDAADQLETLRMRLRIRDLQRDLRETETYGKGGKKRRLRLRGLDRVEANFELREARAEYAATLRANRAQRSSGLSVDAFNDMQRDRRSSSDSFRDRASIDGLSTPAQVERSLERQIADMATLTSLLVALKKKGAAPWLLQQLQSAGPSKAAIRLARHYLADSAALASVNAQATQLQQVAGFYGQVTSDPRWSAPGAWSGGLTAAQSKQLQLIVQTTDQSTIANVVRQVVVHEVMPMLGTGAGIQTGATL